MGPSGSETTRLQDAVQTGPDKLLNPAALGLTDSLSKHDPVLVILAAGKGTRFGQAPKCAQSVLGIPLARHSINAFRSIHRSPVVCIVGYRHTEVASALGDDNIYVLSANPTGGTAFAAFEAFSVPGLLAINPLLVVTMGDRIVTASIFRRMTETHLLGSREADLTLLSAIYEPPRNHGKGRVVRDKDRRVVRIIEQRDIDAIEDPQQRSELLELTEGNCPLYTIRAATLHRHLAVLTNLNAQNQYYFTDIVEAVSRSGGEIRTITTRVSEPDYDLLCSDVTRPLDLALLEGILASSGQEGGSGGVQEAARLLKADRPPGQVDSIAEQLKELLETAGRQRLGFDDAKPIGIGVSGGRIRVAFMHPDMGRFFGPAWQMPFGARDAAGREQVVVLVQSATDGRIHLFPTDPEFREKLNEVPADMDFMYPDEKVADWYTYEGFGTRMAENLLLSLGYFTDEEVKSRAEKGIPIPPPALWVSNSMRRPFSLIGNAIASMRTLRTGNLGAKVQTYLGRDGFRGLRVMSTGNLPQGGFSSSSAVTVAVKNAINALFDLSIPVDTLVHLACQAEYGTGVRAGALDQAAEQKGRPGRGTLISSNPRENYRVLGTFPVPSERFQVLFAYSVERDRAAWAWSHGCYAPSAEPDRLTASEMRKMTGKASELAALLVRLPLDTDFFQYLEQDLLQTGFLSRETSRWVSGNLLRLPLRITQETLREQLEENRQWAIEQWMETQSLTAAAATEKVDGTITALLSGWHDPVLRRTDQTGRIVEEAGMPLRAIVGYLFCEVAKNFRLIHQPEEWIKWVTRSQRGDCCFDIEPARLPSKEALLSQLDWERPFAGPALLDQWLERCEARPFDYHRGIEDRSLSASETVSFHELEGTSFFRGLALIDLAEAMLKRAFGADSVAVRVNAAGQGDFFQVHIDIHKASVAEVEDFIRQAFYRRFDLRPETEFVRPHPGGGAVGLHLSRFDLLKDLIRCL